MTQTCLRCGAPVPGPKQARVLDFVLTFNDVNGRYPRYRDIRIGLGFSSDTAVHYHVKILVQMGLLTVSRYMSSRVIVGARRTA